LETTLARGNSADRQRAAMAERGELDDVVQLVVDETQGPAEGLAAEVPELGRYRSRAGDEAVGLGHRPRPVYADIVEYFRGLKPTDWQQAEQARDGWTADHDFTFGVGLEHRGFHVDLVPRILSPHEWEDLRVGLIQRARTIETFLQDVYGDQRVLADGVLPADRVIGALGWREEATRLPRDVPRAPIMGFDLVRNEFGGWRVLEDNVRNPSGAAYAVAIRDLMDEVLPGLPRPAGLLRPDEALPRLRDTLLARAEPGTRAALFSSGPTASAWFEHRLLAERSDLLLVTADDLDVGDRRVRHRATGQVIGALYLRLDDELVDVVDSTNRSIGAEVFDLAAAGHVVLANAPGNGVADDKAMYCYVPELIGYYLGERPLLESVPTYRTSDETECRIVLERVGELVTKPVDGHGGHGVLIGPDASASAVARRRAEISADPAGWVAQEVVMLSSHPTYSDGLLQPRHVDLRAFVYLRGTAADDCELAPLALTRVGPEGSLVVNSSQGGGAKDTWIIHD
ncbi:MAG TPA: carboxylate--amine ligase/circularly permuted type 2 ATP-grasp protein, partial [Microlunatus sp.]|nr:carboxylate--amine ligase/circularly permuted type 2 ATP-grasp protein [Microlunatus sp.]